MAQDGHSGPTTTPQPLRVSGGHPLAPLHAGEIGRAVAIVRQERPVTAEARFVSVGLHEPAKSQIAFADTAVGAASQSAPPTAAVSLEEFIVLMEPQQHMVYEAVVSPTADSVGFFGHNPALDVAPGPSPHR
jgi:primary-amine oxidase